MTYTVIDLFSGAGGMSYGFHAHPSFRVVAAVDAQKGKPSSGVGNLECNLTYEANIGIRPLELDLALVKPRQLADAIGVKPNILIACAPCTGFTRTNANNHIVDDPRNSLVQKTGLFVNEFMPEILVMENARELLQGRFTHHFDRLKANLIDNGYLVAASTHFLSQFGLPQKRERALVIAVRQGIELKTLNDLWKGNEVLGKAITVRHAIGDLPKLKAGQTDSHDSMHRCPSINEQTLNRLKAIPEDGGSWADLRYHSKREDLLIPSMLRSIAKNKLGSHPDVYGRMWWDKPSVTIKRECGHVGNGRYSHPKQNRQCSVRELAILQGFPLDYTFAANSLANCYRHIGDAVPPLISYQVACLCNWMLTGTRPSINDVILRKTTLDKSHIIPSHQSILPQFV